MTFFAGDGARAVLRVVFVFVTAVAVIVLRWLTRPLWCLIPIVLAILVLVWYLPRLTDSLYGETDDGRLYVRYGVLWHRETVMLLSALRTVEMWTPPLHRLFHCRTVVLRFAGGGVLVPLLDEKTACRLAAQLEEY